MRVPHGDEYCYIDNDMTVNHRLDYRGDFDNKQYRSGNYFNDEKDAKAALEKFKAALKDVDIMEDYQREKINTWDIMLETKDEISKNYSKLLNNQKVIAVLKGADVIEMPNEEDITEKIFSTAGEIVGKEGEITVSHCMKTAKTVVEWLKSKIV